MKLQFPFTDRQRLMLEDESRILWVAAGTKTGKSVAFFAWVIEGLLKGEACIFVAPWFFRCQRAFSEVKVLLEPLIRSRQVRVNESRLQIVSTAGGYLDFRSADNEQNVFGSNYDRVVLDEASRMAPGIYPASLTTISGTGGKLRAAFNVELSSKNWAIGNFLRVQKMDAETRARTGENCLTFPSGGDGLVAPEIIELMRSQMPEVLWRALYLAEIPTSDCSLFRNLDKIFTGQELEGPAYGASYTMGLDLARKSDFSVAMVIDGDGHTVRMDRFNLLSWGLQVERVAELYRTFRCSKVVADATGVGDAVIEQLEAQGLNVVPYIFTVPSRRILLEELILSCDNKSITIPDTETFRVCRNELESFEYTMDGATIRYEAPTGSHDDTVMALALAVHGWRASRGMILGVLEFVKRVAKEIGEGIRDSFGNLINLPAPTPKPFVVRPPAVEAKPVVVDNFKVWQDTHRAPPCPNPDCKSTSTTYNNARKLLCNQCGCIDGVALPKPAGQCCDNFLPQTCGGILRCGSCGWQSAPPGVVVIGQSRKEHAANNSRESKFGRSWGRFGRRGR